MSIYGMTYIASLAAAGMLNTAAHHREVMRVKQASLDRMNVLATLGAGIKPVPISKPAPSKCPCCGSRQFQQHNQRRICAYCRSEQ